MCWVIYMHVLICKVETGIRMTFCTSLHGGVCVCVFEDCINHTLTFENNLCFLSQVAFQTDSQTQTHTNPH